MHQTKAQRWNAECHDEGCSIQNNRKLQLQGDAENACVFMTLSQKSGILYPFGGAIW